MIRPTIELGDPALRQAAVAVPNPASPEVQALIADLRETLYDFRARHGWGRALSAPVIGVPLRVVVIEAIEAETAPMVLVNPTFERWSTDQEEGYESCITFSCLWGAVIRPRSVVVVAQDETGAVRRLEAEGSLARLIQHEIDHLDGLTWLDRGPDLETLCTTAEYRRRIRGT